MIVPLALPNGGRFDTLDREQKNIRACSFETANMRVVQIKRLVPDR
jgi:hypothetical protein